MNDLPRKITFSKVNLGGTEIEDAKIKIFKGETAEGNPVQSWTSEAGKLKNQIQHLEHIHSMKKQRQQDILK